MLTALLIGILVGAVLGLTGAGGSVFAVPLLMLLMHVGMSEATGLALGAVTVSALSGLVAQIRFGQLLWPPALIFAFTGSLTAPVGRIIGDSLDEHVLVGSFCVLAIGIAVRMFLQARRQPAQTRVVRAQLGSVGAFDPICRVTGSQFELRPRCISGLAIAGLVTGLLSGAYGVGGGFIIVPLLTFLANLTMRQAVATSLAIISIIGSAGFIGYLWRTPHISLHMLAAIGLGGIIGMLAGYRFGAKIAGPMLQEIFAVTLMLLVVAVIVTRFVLV
jgi:uncharacterized membrane protein YfcA